MHTLELEDETAMVLTHFASQQDKGVPLPDSFFEPLPDDLLAAFKGKESGRQKKSSSYTKEKSC